MEVSDTTLRDVRVKQPYFAVAGIAEVWIQDVNADLLHVFRGAGRKSVRPSTHLKRGDFIQPLAFPDIRFSMDDFFGPSV